MAPAGQEAAWAGSRPGAPRPGRCRRGLLLLGPRAQGCGLMSTIHRLRPSKRANEATGDDLSETERSVIIAAAGNKLAELFDILHIDHRNDHNTRDTPHRVARMFVDEIMRGRFSKPPVLTEFENVGEFDQLIVMG